MQGIEFYSAWHSQFKLLFAIVSLYFLNIGTSFALQTNPTRGSIDCSVAEISHPAIFVNRRAPHLKIDCCELCVKR